MSLKAFHIAFVTISIALCLFVAMWCRSHMIESPVYAWGAGAALLSAVGLFFYGRAFLKKLKGVGYLVLALAFSQLISTSAQACAVCYGDPNSEAGKALTSSVLFLLGVILFVLAGFITLIVSYNVRLRRMS